MPALQPDLRQHGQALLAAEAEMDHGDQPVHDEVYVGFGPYRSTSAGLFLINDDAEKPDLKLSDPIMVIAETRSSTGENWGVLLAWNDHDGRMHEYAMPRSALAGDGAEARRILMDQGLNIDPTRKGREAFTAYLASVEVRARVRAVDRIGWHDADFALPDCTIGVAGGEEVRLQSLGRGVHAFACSGLLEEWQEQVAAPCRGNSRLVLAVSAAFAAPLLHLADQESGGVHFRGPSSTGKTTALVVAGSAWGGGGVRGYIRQWRATDNGLEATALAHNDALLCLDELSQVDPKAAANTAYMLANGAGKARMAKSGVARPVAEWRLLFLSSGEIGLAEKIAEDGRLRIAAGQQVRVIDLPADAGYGLGLFEDLHGAETADAFARQLKRAAQKHYGTAAREYLIRLVEQVETVPEQVAGFIDEFIEEYCPSGADGQVQRVAARFGLIAAGGEIAVKLGILPWEPQHAVAAAATCFSIWLSSRGGNEPAEIIDGIRQVQAFIEKHGESRFSDWTDDREKRPTLNRAGYRKRTEEGEYEYYIFPQAWRSEVCAGWNASLIANVLLERGHIIPDLSTPDKPTSSHRPPGDAPKRFYRLKSTIGEGGGA